MLLKSPIEITPRLMPGVRVGDAWVQIEYAEGRGHRMAYRWFIDLPDGSEHSGDDLTSGCRHSLQHGLESLLSFLSACGESWRYSYNGQRGENADLVPPAVAEWAAANSDELSMLSIELGEQPDLIEE
jgi:hypothetical protein